jgi:hypothetical protein
MIPLDCLPINLSPATRKETTAIFMAIGGTGKSELHAEDYGEYFMRPKKFADYQEFVSRRFKNPYYFYWSRWYFALALEIGGWRIYSCLWEIP